jgi:hypothetical protein
MTITITRSTFSGNRFISLPHGSDMPDIIVDRCNVNAVVALEAQSPPRTGIKAKPKLPKCRPCGTS